MSAFVLESSIAFDGNAKEHNLNADTPIAFYGRKIHELLHHLHDHQAVSA
jgi:hypothetical protein